jgi:hypothetical protein
MTAPTGGAANGFTVTGETSSYESVARMLSRMSLVPDLTGVTLSSISGSDKLVSFSIAASVKGGTAPASTTPVTPPPAPSTDTTTTDGGATS